MEGQGTRPNDFPLLLHPFELADVDGFVQWRNMFLCLFCRKFSMAYDQYVPGMLRRIIEWVFLVVVSSVPCFKKLTCFCINDYYFLDRYNVDGILLFICKSVMSATFCRSYL